MLFERSLQMVRITFILTFLLFCSQLTAQVGRGGGGWRYPGRYTGAEKIQALEWGTGAAAHLMRRGGFSASPEEIGRLVGQGFEATLSELLDYEAMDDSEMEAGLEAAGLSLIRQNNNGQYLTNIGNLQRWWLYRMIHSRRQLLEKMAFFWHDHFATSVLQVNDVLGAPRGDNGILDGTEKPLSLVQNETLRQYALGNFKEMVHAIARDPAMILWLNNAENLVGNANENWARELLELFTVGESSESAAYTEFDIQEAARAFTGWTSNGRFQIPGVREAWDFYYAAQWHDFQPKTILGQVIVSPDPHDPEAPSSIIDGERVIDIIFEQPQTAIFITRKLWEYFVYNDPSDQLIEELAEVFRSSNYELKPLMRAIFTHPHFMSSKAYRAKIKSPIEFMVGAYRELGVVDPFYIPFYSDIFGLGQQLFLPPDVGGWAHDEGWINTGTVIARFNFMTYVSCNRGRNPGDPPFTDRESLFETICRRSQAQDQVDIAGIIESNNLRFAPDVVSYFANAMLQADQTIDDAYLLEEYMNRGPDGLPELFDINDPVMVDTKVRGVIFLLSLLPTYQLN